MRKLSITVVLLAVLSACGGEAENSGGASPATSSSALTESCARMLCNAQSAQQNAQGNLQSCRCGQITVSDVQCTYSKCYNVNCVTFQSTADANPSCVSPVPLEVEDTDDKSTKAESVE